MRDDLSSQECTTNKLMKIAHVRVAGALNFSAAKFYLFFIQIDLKYYKFFWKSSTAIIKGNYTHQHRICYLMIGIKLINQL